MYSLNSRVSVVLGLSALAAAFNLDLPQPTPTVKGYSLDGFTPKPTGDPFNELRRKRDTPESVCAYLTGDPTEAYTCASGGVCGYNTVASWFGCCEGESNGRPTGCPVVTGCVPYASINACLSDSVCASDSYMIACTNSATPYCAAGALTAGTDTLLHYFCDTTVTVLEFELTATGGAASSVFEATTTSDDTFETSTPLLFKSASVEQSSITGGPSDTPAVIIKTVTPSTAKTTSSVGGGLAIPLSRTTATPPPSTSTAGAAARTAGAAVGAAGGVAGLLMLLV